KGRPIIQVLDSHYAAGTKHAPHFHKRPDRLTQVVQYSMREGRVERVVGEGKPVRVGHLEAHTRYSALSRQSLRLLDLGGLKIDADDVARGYHLDQTDRDRPRTAA